jgi:inositol oxygenase
MFIPGFPRVSQGTEFLIVLRWHREGAYSHLTNEKDKRALAAVRAFNPYDLYSKSDQPVDIEALRPYYERLIAKFFPPVLDW